MKKIGEILKSNIYGIIGMFVIGLATWFGNTFKKGHDVNKKEEFITLLVSSESIHVIDSVFELKAHEKTTDFKMFDKILKSPFIGNYAMEFENKIIAEYEKRDSLKGNMVDQLGAGAGIRNEDVMPLFIELLTAYKEGRLYYSRTVHNPGF